MRSDVREISLCPDCGGVARLDDGYYVNYNAEMKYTTRYRGYCLRFLTCGRKGPWRLTTRGAAAAWNRGEVA